MHYTPKVDIQFTAPIYYYQYCSKTAFLIIYYY